MLFCRCSARSWDREPSESFDYLYSIKDELGGPLHYNHMPVPWSWAFDTPFQWTKRYASHFGGTRNGMVMSWPNRIKDVGGLRAQDYALAHMWFNLASSPATNADLRQMAVQNRDQVAAKMTPAQIAEAEQMAREWVQSHPSMR